jgi:hypothetical protein
MIARIHIGLVLLGATVLIGLPPNIQESKAASEGFCRTYANNANIDYRAMKRFPKCAVQPSPRWQSNYNNHHGWCLTVPIEWVKSEAKARDDWLLRCGARVKFD